MLQFQITSVFFFLKSFLSKQIVLNPMKCGIKSWASLFSFSLQLVVHAFCRLLTFFKIIFSRFFFRNTARVSNSLDPDQVWHIFGPDLGPNG